MTHEVFVAGGSPEAASGNRYGHVCSISRLIDEEKINSHDDDF